MKRKLLINLLSIVAILFFWQAGFSQNLLVNGGMENWKDATTLTGWTTAQSITQETATVHSGTYSAKQIGGTKKLGQSIDVTPGDTYNISIWYYVESGDGTDARIWSYWKDGSGSTLSDNANELRGPNGSYLKSDASWQNYTATVTAPANAAKLSFELRTYKNATVYWDDVSVELSGGNDTQPPTWTSGYPQAVHVEDTRGTFLVNLDEPGKVYFIVVPSGATAPTAAQVKAGADYGSVTLFDRDSIEVSQANTTTAFNFTGAQPNTSADIWFVAEDNAGNLQSSPVKISITTTGTRSLTIDKPLPNTTYNIGDTIKLEWTSQNIDSLLIGMYPVSQGIGAAFILTGPVAGADGMYNLAIPHQAFPGDYGLILWDAYDTTFKQTTEPFTVQDNRSLHLTKPQDNDTVYVGDTLTFKWTSANIDSVLIGGYIGGGKGPDGGYFMLTGDIDHFDTATFRPVPAQSGTFKMYLDPNNMGGSIQLDSVFIWDAADMQLKDYASPVYVLDTFPMRIASSMPEFGMNDFMPGSGINADFSCDSIIRGTGYLYLKKADGTVMQTISADSIELHGNGISFMPHPELVPGQSYYIEIDSGFVKCADGSKTFPGLKGNEWNFTAASSSLYFSEYIEGSSNNKALEIYNPTDHDISLDDYIIAGSYNGSGINQDKDVYHFPKGYILKSGRVFVVANSQSDTAILAHANDTVAYNEGGYVCGFNGNDARVLIKQTPHRQMWIDAIGNPWDNPVNGWNVAGVTAATKDHTLLRKINVKMGNGGNWGMSAGSGTDNSQWIVKDKNYFGNIGFPTTVGNSQSDIESVMLMNKDRDNVTVSTRIVQNKDSVYVTVLSGTDVTQMYGDIHVSAGAEIHPDSTEVLDFTNPLQFTVIAENGIDSTVWTIAVSVASSPSSEANIISFSMPDAMSVMVNNSTHSVSVLMPFGTDVTALIPEITVSAGATISPASGIAQDFTNPVVYKVTAQDGTTTTDWTVTVNIERTSYVSIHNIQYTTDTSGDSPYKGQMVRTSGVVTALNVYKGARKGYFIEGKEAAWNGIYVYDPDMTNNVAVGDSVEVAGTVDEYYNFTEIKDLKHFNNFGSGFVRMPVDVSTGLYSDEQWEAVLIKFVNATCTNASLGKGEVEVDDGTGAGIIDDYLFQYDPFTLNDVYTVTGVVNYWYGKFTLNPRNADDISNVTGISNSSLAENISVYPNPGNGLLNIGLNDVFKGDVTVRVMDITGRVVYSHIFKNVISGKLFVNISNEPSNLYFISISDSHNMIVKKFMKR